MADHAYAEIEFEKYYRWFTRVMAKPMPFIACDTEGKLLWCNNEGNDCANILAKLQAEQFDWACQGDGMQRHDLDHALSLLYFPVIAKGPKRIGWLAVTAASPKNDVVPVEWTRLPKYLKTSLPPSPTNTGSSPS